MAVSARALSPARAENLGEFETLQTIVVFCGVGLVLSLLLAVNGWICTPLPADAMAEKRLFHPR
jgi:hypothetical protein